MGGMWEGTRIGPEKLLSDKINTQARGMSFRLTGPSRTPRLLVCIQPATHQKIAAKVGMA